MEKPRAFFPSSKTFSINSGLTRTIAIPVGEAIFCSHITPRILHSHDLRNTGTLLNYSTIRIAYCLPIYFLIACNVLVAQQIAPNPNPAGNTISVTGNQSNDVVFENSGNIEISGGGALENLLLLNNHGTIVNESGGILIDKMKLNNRNTIINDNASMMITSVCNEFNATLTNDNFGMLNIGGSLLNGAAVINDNFSLLENDGCVRWNGIGTWTNRNGSMIINNHVFDELFLVNEATATIENNGNMDLHTFHNHGNFNNEQSGDLYIGSVFENHGLIINHGSLESFADFNQPATGTIFNHGFFKNSDTVLNLGGFRNEGGHFVNEGTFINGYFMINNGQITNNNVLRNNLKLEGNGVILGLLEDHGQIFPGTPPGNTGVMTLENWCSNGFIHIDIGGEFDGGGDKSLTEFDWIHVTGDADLFFNFNHVQIQLINNFVLTPGMTFEIIDVEGTLTQHNNGISDGDRVAVLGDIDVFVTFSGGDGNDVVLYTNPTPINDDLDGSLFMLANPDIGTVGTNVDSTTQVNEQDLDETGSTVWFFFVATSDGLMTVNTFGSDFDTQLHVYTQSSTGIENLNLVASNNDASAGGTLQSEASFVVTSGTIYQIRVGGFRAMGQTGPGAEGNILLQGNFEPIILGDVNLDGIVNLLDVEPFIDLLSNGSFQLEADINGDGSVNLLDVQPFISLLSS